MENVLYRSFKICEENNWLFIRFRNIESDIPVEEIANNAKLYLKKCCNMGDKQIKDYISSKRLELYEKCYNYFENNNWSPYKVRNFIETENMDIKTIIFCLKKYMSKYYFGPNVIESKTNVIRNYEIFEDYKNIYNEVEFDYLKVLKKVGSLCYECGKTFNFVKINEFLNDTGIDYNCFKRYISDYINNILQINDNKKFGFLSVLESQKQKYDAKECNDSKAIFYEKLIKEDNINKIIELFDSIDVRSYDVKHCALGYVLTHHREEANELYKIIEEKVDLYNYFRKKSKNNSKELTDEIALLYANKYLNSEYIDEFEFSENENINITFFRKCLSTSFKIDKDLKEKVLAKINRHDEIKEKLNLVIKYLKEGIVEDDSIRPFDLLDYYEIMGCSFSSTRYFAGKLLNPYDYKYLSIFFNNNKVEDDFIMTAILETEVRVKVLKDENGNLIPDSGILISNEEKMNIINELKEKNIPLSNRIYTVALKRYTDKLKCNEKTFK